MSRFRAKCQARETKTSERRRVHLLLTGREPALQNNRLSTWHNTEKVAITATNSISKWLALLRCLTTLGSWRNFHNLPAVCWTQVSSHYLWSPRRHSNTYSRRWVAVTTSRDREITVIYARSKADLRHSEICTKLLRLFGFLESNHPSFQDNTIMSCQIGEN